MKENSVIIRFNSLEELYEESSKTVNGCSIDSFKRNLSRNDPSFVGMTLEELPKNKFSCEKYIHLLKDFDMNQNLGSSGNEKIFSETDGYDMNMDKYYDGEPKCLIDVKKRKEKGKIGKYITLYVSICENCGVSPNSMLQRALFATKLADILEMQKYRVTIIATADVDHIAVDESGNEIDHMRVEIVLKKFEEPCIPSYVLCGLGPWIFRYYLFNFWYGHYKCHSGLGYTVNIDCGDRQDVVIINSGECFSDISKEKKIKEIEDKFIKSDENLLYENYLSAI